MAKKETDVSRQGKQSFPKSKQKTIKKPRKTTAEKAKKQRQTTAKINTARSANEKTLVKAVTKTHLMLQMKRIN